MFLTSYTLIPSEDDPKGSDLARLFLTSYILIPNETCMVCQSL